MTNNTKKWLNALRSGKYQQRRGFLNKGGKFCCLGVACELAIEDGVPLVKIPVVQPKDVYPLDPLDPLDPDVVFSYNGMCGLLCDSVEKWLGCNVHQNMLIELNDKRHYTFEQIAEYVESLDKEVLQ